MQKYLQSTHRSVIWFKRTSDAGELDSRPPFQRNPVWSPRQQSALIDTILSEYPIPEIYMQELTSSAGEQRQIIIDGQQRINSILGFINGDYSLEGLESKWDGLQFDDLGDADKRKIFEYNLLVRILPEISEPELREIFLRINRNSVSLNLQELRHATYWGPFIKLMEEVSDFDLWNEFRLFSANDRRRMLDTEFVSELAVAMLNGLQNKKKKLEEYYQIYELEFPESEKVRTSFIVVLEELRRILPSLSETRWKKKSDFYSLFLVIQSHEAMLPLSEGQRSLVREKLNEFELDITRFQEADTSLAPDILRPSVSQYIEATEKAASDLGSRKARDECLRFELQGVFN